MIREDDFEAINHMTVFFGRLIERIENLNNYCVSLETQIEELSEQIKPESNQWIEARLQKLENDMKEVREMKGEQEINPWWRDE